MRNRFDEQLFELNREIIEMGAMCEEAIASAVKALTTGDMELAGRVKATGGAIDQMERDIEGRCMKLLLHQQPVARDLRLISAALKMITDMERIGDQAEDIAEIVTSLNGHAVEGMELIEEMARETIEMVTESVDAFVKKDVTLAQKVIDALHAEIRRLLEDGISDEEFIMAKDQLKVSYVLGLESSSSRMSSIGRSKLLRGRAVDPQDVVRKIEAVTKEDVERIVKRIFTEKCAASVVGRNIDNLKVL